MSKLSVIIPSLDEPEMIAAVITGIDAAFRSDQSAYEIIFTGVTSTQSFAELDEYMPAFPVRRMRADEAETHARYEATAYVTAYSQAALEILPEMAERMGRTSADILIADFRRTHASLRLLINKVVKHSYGELPPWLEFDTHSGVRVFRRELLTRLHTSAQDNDIFIEARDRGFLIASHRPHAKKITKRRSLKKSVSAFKSKILPDPYVEFDPDYAKSHGRGFRYKGREYVTHNALTRKDSAIERTTVYQRLVIVVLAVAVIAGAQANHNTLLVTVVSLLTALYFCDLLFNMMLIYRSMKTYSEIVVKDEEIAEPRKWPTYTVLCPLYKEALVVPQFISAMRAIDYPKEKLEVLLLLEEDDGDTIDAIQEMDLPKFFKITVVPDAMPKTKPKACNYGLQRATGEYAVIYDAEDMPDPLQLKKAVIAFERSADNIGCIQAKLNYYNWNQNLLTRLFTLEYSLWFNLILTGLQSIKAPIPLGGTSNHFRTRILSELGGWDPFNVTEDADLGIRLAKRGLKTAVLDSTTLEEANSAPGNWLKQRSRWIKGYMQTYLVHMRDPREFGRGSRRIDMITFQLIIGGKVLSMLINPLLWAMTISYFAFRPEVGAFVESLYLTPVFYLGALSLIIGNFLYLYYYMIGAARQDRPELIIFAVFVPFYWLMMSVAAAYALRDLLVRPFHWHKTKHGLHLKKTRQKAV